MIGFLTKNLSSDLKLTICLAAIARKTGKRVQKFQFSDFKFRYKLILFVSGERQETSLDHTCLDNFIPKCSSTLKLINSFKC